MIRRPPTYLVIGCGLLLAFVFGRFTANRFPGYAAIGLGESPASVSRQKSPADSPGDRRPGTAGGVVGNALAAAAEKAVVEHAALMATEPPGLARSALLESLIERVTPANWNEVFQVMGRARLEGMISEREEQWFLQRVGEVAGVAAMDRFKPADPVKDFETNNGRHAMRGWVQADPAGALGWLEAQPEGNYRTGMAQGFVRGAAAQDPKAALRVTGMLAPADQEWLVNSILKAEEGSHCVPFIQDWLASGALDAADPRTMQVKAQVFGLLVETQTKVLWNDRDGSRLTQWVGQFAGREFVSAPALSRLMENLSGRMDAPRMMELLDRMAAPVLPGQSDPVRVVMQRWSRKDPEAAQAWLNEHRNAPSYDTATAAFIQNAAIGDPAVKRAWIETLQGEAVRERAMSQFNEAQNAAVDGR